MIIEKVVKMFDKKINIGLIFIIIIAFLLIFFAGRFVYSNYFVNQSLKKYLEQNEEIENYKLIKQKLNITPKRPQTIKEVYLDIKIWLDNEEKEITIDIIDNPSKNISEIETDMELIVYQGLATGEYLTMKTELENLIKKENSLNYELIIDQENSLIIILKDKDNYIFESYQLKY